jgi:hypothetical protein
MEKEQADQEKAREARKNFKAWRKLRAKGQYRSVAFSGEGVVRSLPPSTSQSRARHSVAWDCSAKVREGTMAALRQSATQVDAAVSTNSLSLNSAPAPAPAPAVGLRRQRQRQQEESLSESLLSL